MKLGGWERPIIYLGIITSTLPLTGLYFNLFVNPEFNNDAFMVSITCLVLVWVNAGVLIWVLRGFRKD